MVKLLRQKQFQVIFAVLIIGLILRLPHLNGSLWLDEAAQALESRRPLSEQLQIVDDFQPPLIHLLVHGLLYFSEAEWILRTGAALLPGLVTIAALMLILEREKIKHLPLIAGLLLATSSFHIFYSQELRPYSLPAMFTTLGWLVVTKIVREHSSEKKKLTLLATFTVISILGLYSSYLYPFALIGQLLYFVLERPRTLKNLQQLGCVTAAVLLGFAPWVPSFLDQLRAGQSLRKDLPGWESVVSFTQFKSLALTAGKFIFGVLDLSSHPLFIISIIIIGSCSIYLTWQAVQKKPKGVWNIIKLCLYWAGIPITLAWVISFWVPVIQPKRVLFALPALSLFFAWLITTWSAKQPNKLSTTVASTLAVVLFSVQLFSSISYYIQPKYQREDWRGMHALITEKYGKGDAVVIFAFPAPFASWEWYNRTEQFPTQATGSFVLSFDATNPDRVRLKKLAEYNYVLVFDYLRDLTDPQHLIEQDLVRYGFEEVDRITPTTQVGIVHVYARTRQIIGFSEYSASYARRN
jgi:mannosyltransferase